jgi:hypothetical protein
LRTLIEPVQSSTRFITRHATYIRIYPDPANDQPFRVHSIQAGPRSSRWLSARALASFSPSHSGEHRPGVLAHANGGTVRQTVFARVSAPARGGLGVASPPLRARSTGFNCAMLVEAKSVQVSFGPLGGCAGRVRVLLVARRRWRREPRSSFRGDSSGLADGGSAWCHLQDQFQGLGNRGTDRSRLKSCERIA